MSFNTNVREQFIPTNPTKYCGSYPIVVRSSWERMLFQWVDLNPYVVKWSSESLIVRYYDPVQMKTRRYYPDVYMKVVDKTGKYKEYVVEVKPYRETQPPVKKGRKSMKTQQHQERTYITNKAKWTAAIDHCRKLNMEFKLITEKQLFVK